MRTTLDIDEDILIAAKELAAAKNRSAGKVLSDLARATLSRRSASRRKARNGFPQLTNSKNIVTSEHVARLLDDE